MYCTASAKIPDEYRTGYIFLALLDTHLKSAALAQGARLDRYTKIHQLLPKVLIDAF
jgi:hypothetical protein